jgi:hypothetical protein
MGFSNSPAATSCQCAERLIKHELTSSINLCKRLTPTHECCSHIPLTVQQDGTCSTQSETKNLKIPAFQDSRKAPRLLRRPVRPMHVGYPKSPLHSAQCSGTNHCAAAAPINGSSSAIFSDSHGSFSARVFESARQCAFYPS